MVQKSDSIQVELIRTGILSEDWESEVNTRIAAIDEWYARWEPIASESYHNSLSVTDVSKQIRP